MVRPFGRKRDNVKNNDIVELNFSAFDATLNETEVKIKVPRGAALVIAAFADAGGAPEGVLGFSVDKNKWMTEEDKTFVATQSAGLDKLVALPY